MFGFWVQLNKYNVQYFRHNYSTSVSHHDQTFLWFKEWESFIAKSKLVWQLEYNFVFLNRRNVFTFMMKFNED